MFARCQLLGIFLLGEFCILFGDSALCHDDDREAGSSLVSVLDRIDDLVDIIRDLRQQDDICAGSHACIEGKPADLVAHDLNNEDAAVGAGRRMDLVNSSRCNIHRALETEGHIRAPEVIVDRLGKRDDIQAFLGETVSRLGGAVASEHDKAVQLQLVIVLFHCLDLIQAVLIRLVDGLKRNTACSEDRAAARKDAGEIRSGQHTELAVDQSFVAILKAIKLIGLLAVVLDHLDNAAHCSIECLAVTAACQKTDT